MSYWPDMQCERVELWRERERERAPTSLYLQLVSCLLHHKVVQALQIPPTVMLITLLPCSEDDQGGVTAHLDNIKKKNITILSSLGNHGFTPS